jgi:type II secretory pathway component PulF
MWLYPLPVVLSIIIWLFVFVSTGWFALWGVLLAATGLVVYLLKTRYEKSRLGLASKVE